MCTVRPSLTADFGARPPGALAIGQRRAGPDEPTVAPNAAGLSMDDAIRQKILTLLDQHRIMTIATLRPDGWPQATTVGYVNDGLTLYFLCGLDSQKAANLARDERVSLTI